MGERTDDDWLALMAARDGAAVAELRDRLCRGLVKVLAGRTDPSAAEDFAQEATLRVLDRLADFRGESRFLTWALAVATRVAFSELRKARYRDVSLDALTASGATVPEPAAGSDDVAARLDRTAAIDTLRRLIDTTLTDRQRAVIRAELDGVPQAVIADRLGTSRNALYKLGHDARMKLKHGLEAAGISADEVRAMRAGASNG
ncbi:MAG: RNA polymerase sigma factor [Isosphaera sp.]|nr:RNA polymerase sigma factor [Isosphaera sp.]